MPEADASPVPAAAAPGEPLLAGKAVILTGAAGGIGRHVAAGLAAAGARVGLTDVSGDGIESLVHELACAGAEVTAAALDGADPDRFSAFHRQVRDALGEVDGLITCAGRWAPKAFDEIALDELAATFTANVTTAFVACQAVLPAMIARRRGSVVNFASTAGEYGSITPAAHYAAAKGAVIGMTKSLAREASPHGVRVNAISPGPTDTVALGAATPEQKAAAGARTLFNRLGRPEEIATSCVYLISDMSSFVTGTVLQVNGGSLL
jgi:NAD(P)-dependent dehydrogenase (short-subunit alcohol dehydrogenase family)